MAHIFEEKKIEQKYHDVFLPIVDAAGMEIYDLEYIQGQFLIRLYIRNPETSSATIQECAIVDRALSPVFEAEEWMPEKIVLEVSSPGITRKLKKLQHFEEAIGESIMIHLHKKMNEKDGEIPKAVQGQNKFILLVSKVSENEIVGMVEDTEIKINFENIKRAAIEPDWDSMMNEDSSLSEAEA